MLYVKHLQCYLVIDITIQQLINYYGNIRKLTRWQKLKDMWRGRWRALKKFQLFDGIYDHNMDKYCSKLHKLWEKDTYVYRSEVSAWKKGTKE